MQQTTLNREVEERDRERKLDHAPHNEKTVDSNLEFKFGSPGLFSLTYINYIKIQYMHIWPYQ